MLMSEIAEIVMWVLIWIACGLVTALLFLREFKTVCIRREGDAWVPDKGRFLKTVALCVAAWPYFFAGLLMASFFGLT